jgi:disulfide bond formation protein DsbB
MNASIRYLAWLLVTIATLGSLFFSQVLQLPPCNLCWWQRICMFPLTIIFAIGFVKKDSQSFLYALPLVLLGLLISFYHNLLYYGWLEKSFTACTSGLSCTSKQIEWLGFITIPLLSFIAFALLASLTIFTVFKNKEKI